MYKFIANTGQNTLHSSKLRGKTATIPQSTTLATNSSLFAVLICQVHFT